MRRTFVLFLLGPACFGWGVPLPAATHQTRNFTVTAPTARFAQQVAEAAEAYRRELAIDWLGEPLPGNWTRACAVHCRVGSIGAGGATMFRFENSEVFGWSMTLQGSEERILDSVLPHEVLHTVLASHFRRPVPRWADEGAATLVEHESERRRQRLLLNEIMASSRRIPLRQLLQVEQYPTGEQDVLALYAEGFSLTELLVRLRGRRVFVEFLGDAMQQGWETAFGTHYGFSGLSHVEETWQRWQAAGAPHFTACVCAEGGWVPLKEHVEPRNGKPVLEIWTNPQMCPPCRQLQEDWDTDRAFRDAVTERYHVRWYLVDGSTWPQAEQQGVRSIPTFIVIGQRLWSGYADESGNAANVAGRKAALLKRLGINAKLSAPSPRPAEGPQPTPAYVTQEQLRDALQRAFQEFTAQQKTVPGPMGPPGSPGRDGRNGRGIARVFLDGARLLVEYDDGTTGHAGDIIFSIEDRNEPLFTVVFEPGDEPGEHARSVNVPRGGELLIPRQLLRIRSVDDAGNEVGEPMFDAAPLGMPLKLRFRKPLPVHESLPPLSGAQIPVRSPDSPEGETHDG